MGACQVLNMPSVHVSKTKNRSGNIIQIAPSACTVKPSHVCLTPRVSTIETKTNSPSSHTDVDSRENRVNELTKMMCLTLNTRAAILFFYNFKIQLYSVPISWITKPILGMFELIWMHFLCWFRYCHQIQDFLHEIFDLPSTHACRAWCKSV